MQISKIRKLIVTGLLSFFLTASFVSAGDLLQKGFEPSIDGGAVLNVGNDKNAVGSFFFGGGVVIGTGGIEVEVPFIVRIATLLLRLTLIFGITMMIYNGIRFIGSMGKEATRQSLGKTIGFLALGIILALGSVVLVNILQSVTRSSITDSPDPIGIHQEDLNTKLA